MNKTPGDGRSVVSARSRDSFGDRLVVDCPSCGGKAVITPLAPDTPGPNRDSAPRRMLCHACGAVREQAQAPPGQLMTPFMGLTPRLRAQTRHGELVAWNEDHLDYLEQHLSGRLRVETASDGGVRNASVVSRLPAWAKAAKNRDEILKAIARLRRDKL